MAKHTTISLVADQWTQLTDADVLAITYQNQGPYTVYVVATADASAPTDRGGALKYDEGHGELNSLLADMWPGIAGKRVWAWAEDAGKMMVGHT